MEKYTKKRGRTMKKKKSVCLAIGGLLGLAYFIYICVYFTGVNTSSTDAAEAIGGAIATALVTPHMICVAIAVIFNLVGFFANKPWAALTAGILYAVGGVLFLAYFMFVIPSMVLCFVGYARVKKFNNEAATVSM